jgi:hypothetical protein
MPQTIKETADYQIIGGIFSSRDNADNAVEAFRKLGIPDHDVQLVVKLNDEEVEDTYSSILMHRGIAEPHALYYNKVIREGKVFVAVYDVIEPGPVIDIFDNNQAEHNPNGSRNLRQDVVGMTTGAVVGAAVLGTVGAVLGGPLGAAGGAVAGAALGGGSGAIAGTAIEHNK